MKRLPTFALVDLVRELAGQRWRPWQPDMVRHMLAHPYSVIQGARQGTGKTSTTSKFIAACVALGLSVGVGMPTLRQGGRLLLRETLRRLEPLEAGLPAAFKRVVKNSLEYVWKNGASLTALSTDDAARAGAQGYTFDVLVIDEGHESKPENTLDIFLPLVDVAMVEGRGRVVVLGVGGTLDSTIETVKAKGWPSLTIDDQRIIREAPAWAPIFEARKRDFSERQYRQMYQCLPVLLGGGHAILPGLVASGEPRWQGGMTLPTLGVDVGRHNDATIAAVLEHRQGLVVWGDTLVLEGMPLTEQVPLIAEHARRNRVRHEHIAIEVNGIGQGLYDIATHGPAAPLLGCQAVALDYGLKSDVLEQMNRDAREGVLVIPDEARRQHLSGLRYVTKSASRGGVRLDYDHSDELSAGVMAYCAKQRMGVAA